MTASWGILEGDCAVILSDLTEYEGTIDALVTDPPAGIGFMGKDWDGDKGGREEWIAWLGGVMRDVLRLLKPGAHGLVWALPRTSHWTATALENAGFEIRDVITHHFGTGFPKSLNVAKALDAHERFGGSGSRQLRARDGNTVGVVGTNMNKARSGKNDVVEIPNCVCGHQGNWHDPDCAFEGCTCTKWRSAGEIQSETAKNWAGWGTALKPASEHWILIRKPLIGTVAANVQAFGTGALNIDASRIRSDEVLKGGGGKLWSHYRDDTQERAEPRVNDGQGRWPANLILSHGDCGEECAPGCPVVELDRQSGISKSAGGRIGKAATSGVYGSVSGAHEKGDPGFGDVGGASRFFYCAKPSTRERNEGLVDAKNTHPTVKSQALMTYLVRLITPPGGLVLDPFCGSGSTGVACVAGGWEFLGIEQDPTFAAVARARIEAVSPQSSCAAGA